jgi:hypothetical protein
MVNCSPPKISQISNPKLLNAIFQFAVCGQGVIWDWSDQESCLNPSLSFIMNDQNALTYFIQFLEPLHALCYVHFWISAENFKKAVLESGAIDEINDRERIDKKLLSDRKHGIVPQWSEYAPLTTFQQTVRDAVKICDKYLKSTSSWPKPLPRDSVESILQNIRNNSACGKAFDPDVFLPAQQMVLDILRKE